ncbi:MAG: succinyl-diaminopimelate desuccinylase [Candidatus Nanopelagicales bacterium]
MLNINQELSKLTLDLVNISSVSKDEKSIADSIAEALKKYSHLKITRVNNSIVAQTNFGNKQRVVIAGHIDTVPANNNFPGKINDSEVIGLGSVDMKSGIAVALKLASEITSSNYDVTYLFYESEEIETKFNGLELITKQQKDLLDCDFAILMEPTNGILEVGCQGSLRFEVSTSGKRSHSARWWNGENAIHKTNKILEILNNYKSREPEIDGHKFREGLQAVKVNGGIAGNVVPDSVTISINHRFAPDTSIDQATQNMKTLFKDFNFQLVDAANAAPTGLSNLLIKEFVSNIGKNIAPKFGWTDVARFANAGIPAINFGPGDPNLAHHPEEKVLISQINDVYESLKNWLTK